MTLTAASEPSPSEGRADLDRVVDAFELAWQRGSPPSLDAFLPAEPAHPLRRELLEELVKIDLEYRWQGATVRLEADVRSSLRDVLSLRPRIEHYAIRFPELAAAGGIGPGLIGEEYRARLRWGDRPAIVEYLARFPDLAGPLQVRLEQIEADLAAEYGGAAPPRPACAAIAAPHESPAEAFPSGPVLPDLEILGLLGRGGMGIVYKARQVRLNRLVAVKMILTGPHADQGELSRFQTEAEVAARLVDPNIVQIHQVGSSGGRPYVVLELVEGGTLAAKLARQTLFAPAAARLVETLARAIHGAHQKGVIHRDLKPANILLAPQPAGSAGTDPEIPKISDFGLAKWLDDGPAAAASSDTQSGAILGSPNYMAPEQAIGDSHATGPAADIYALGAILYESITGRPPFQGPSVLETLEQVRSQAPVPPGRLQPGVPRDLETICLKCLAKEPERRYASAALLADDLARFQAGEPIRARPVPAWERLTKWAQRHKAVASLTAVSALALIVLAASTLAYTVRLNAASKLAQVKRAEAESHFLKAFEAVNSMLSKVGQFDLDDAPEMSEVRRELLAEALVFLQGFLAQREGNDPLVRREIGMAYSRLSLVHGLLGQGDRATGDLLKAIEYQSRLVAEYPDRWEYRRDLGSSYHDLGLTRGGPTREAEYRTALALLEPLPTKDPTTQWIVASCYNSLGNLLFAQRHYASSESCYRKSLAIREAFARTDPVKHQAAPATVHHNLGLLYHQIGRTRESEEAFRAAIALLEPVAKDRRRYRVFLAELAECHQSLGTMLAELGRGVEAEPLLVRAVSIRDRLAHLFPGVPAHRDSLGRAHHVLGELYLRSRRPRDAEESFLKSIAIREALAREFPDDPGYALSSADTIQDLGLAYRGLGRTDDAEASYRKALKILDATTQGKPGDSHEADAIASTCMNLGSLLCATNRSHESLNYHDRAVAILEPVVRAHPADVAFRRRLASAFGSRAQARTVAERHAEALDDWGRFRDLADAAGIAAHRFEIATAVARAGQHERATVEAHELEGQPGMDVADRYNLACLYALAAVAARRDECLSLGARDVLAEQYANQSLRLLRASWAAGFFGAADERLLLESDPDLEAIRTRDDFRELARQVSRAPESTGESAKAPPPRAP